MKLTPKIILIVIVASVVPLAILGQMVLSGVNAFSDEVNRDIYQFGQQAKAGVVNVSQEYLVRAGQEAVRMKAQDLALQVQTYVEAKLAENPDLTTRDLMNDSQFLSIALQMWGAKEYTWVGAGAVINGEPRAVLVAHPVVPEKYWGLDVKYHLQWDKKMPDLYGLLVKVMENPESPQPYCGYYTWVEPTTGEKVKKYLCHYPTNVKVYDPVLGKKVFLIAGTSAYIDGYFQYLTQNPANPSENIAGEIDKNVELAGQQVYTSLEAAKQRIYMGFGIALAIAAVFIAVLAFFTMSNIAGPIVEVSKVADRISEGELEAEVPFQDRDDEIGILAKSIERLRRSLKVAMDSLEEALK